MIQVICMTAPRAGQFQIGALADYLLKYMVAKVRDPPICGMLSFT